MSRLPAILTPHVLKAYRPGADPLAALRDALVAGWGVILKAKYDENLHPRDDRGRWVSKTELARAKKNPVKAAELRLRVTDPEQRKKLDKAIGDDPKKDPVAAPATGGDAGKIAPEAAGKPDDGLKGYHHPDVVAARVHATHNAVESVLASAHPDKPARVARLLAGHTRDELTLIRDRLGIAVPKGKKAEVVNSIALRAAGLADPRQGFTGVLRHKSGKAVEWRDGKPVAVLDDHAAQSRVSVDDAHARVNELAAAGELATEKGKAELADTLLHRMTAAEVADLKRRVGVKAGGNKAELVRKVVDRLAEARRAKDAAGAAVAAKLWEGMAGPKASPGAKDGGMVTAPPPVPTSDIAPTGASPSPLPPHLHALASAADPLAHAATADHLGLHDEIAAGLNGAHGEAVRAAVGRGLDDWGSHGGKLAPKYAAIARELRAAGFGTTDVPGGTTDVPSPTTGASPGSSNPTPAAPPVHAATPAIPELPDGFEFRRMPDGSDYAWGLYEVGGKSPLASADHPADAVRNVDRIVYADKTGFAAIHQQRADDAAKRQRRKKPTAAVGPGQITMPNGTVVGRAELARQQHEYLNAGDGYDPHDRPLPKPGQVVERLIAGAKGSVLGSTNRPASGVLEVEPDGLHVVRVTAIGGDTSPGAAHGEGNNRVAVGDRVPYHGGWRLNDVAAAAAPPRPRAIAAAAEDDARRQREAAGRAERDARRAVEERAASEPHTMTRREYEAVDATHPPKVMNARGFEDFTRGEMEKYLETNRSDDVEHVVFHDVNPASGRKTGRFNIHAKPTHKKLVKDAIAAGKPVPPEVLADYPDLAGGATPAGPPTPPPGATPPAPDLPDLAGLDDPGVPAPSPDPTPTPATAAPEPGPAAATPRAGWSIYHDRGDGELPVELANFPTAKDAGKSHEWYAGLALQPHGGINTVHRPGSGAAEARGDRGHRVFVGPAGLGRPKPAAEVAAEAFDRAARKLGYARNTLPKTMPDGSVAPVGTVWVGIDAATNEFTKLTDAEMRSRVAAAGGAATPPRVATARQVEAPAPATAPEATAAVPGPAEPVPTPPTAPETPPPATPRQAAAAHTAASAGDYAFARSSAVPNAGADLKGSARHLRNQWRGLEQAERDGTAEHLVTRDNLLKNEPHALLATISPHSALTHLAAHLAIQSFPTLPYSPDEYKQYAGQTRSGRKLGDTAPEKLREQYYEAYRAVKAEAERAAVEESDPKRVLARVQSVANGLVRKYRGQAGNTSIDIATAKDRFNPVANALVDLVKRTEVTRWGKPAATSAHGRLEDFARRAKEKYGDLSAANIGQVLQHAQDVVEGESFNKTFGTVKAGGRKFDAAEAYVKHATRKGGRVIDANTVAAGTDFLTKNLGLRGLQWGNSVSDDERQHHLTKSAEALADLADVTGLPDHAISLGGALGLAVGARGKGSAMAHYDPEGADGPVINLTRKKGVGSLAHEWGHALDHHVNGRKMKTVGRERHAEYLSESDRPREWTGAGWAEKDAEPVHAAMLAVRDTMKASGYDARLRKELQEALNRGEISGEMANYYLDKPEKFARVFERHVQHKLHGEGRENTYLSGVGSHPFWPTPEETAAIAPAMESLFAAVREKHFGGTAPAPSPSAVVYTRDHAGGTGADGKTYGPGERMPVAVPPTR